MEGILAKGAADLALQGTGWLCAVLLGGWSFYLFKLLRDADKENRDLLKQVITIAESSKSGLSATAKAVDDMGGSIGTLTQGVQALSREVEGDERETRHGLGGLASGQTGIAERLGRLTERLERLSDQILARERP